MADENLLTKEDILVMLTAQAQEFEAKMAQRDEQFKKELDIQANKIHSSYTKKMKQDLSTDEDAPKGKQSKRELELEDLIKKNNESISEFMKRDELRTQELAEAKTRETVLSHKNEFVTELSKLGFQPTQIETIYKLQQFDKAFVEDGRGGFNWKVKANGIDVALPVGEAAKHFTKSELAEQFLPAKTNGGGTKVSSTQQTSNLGNGRKIEVDWASVSKDMQGMAPDSNVGSGQAQYISPKSLK